MSRSMTGYARISKASSLGTFLLELHSVNRKTLDFSLYLPKECLRFDLEIRKWVSAVIERGQLTVRLSFQPDPVQHSVWQGERLEQLKAYWQGMCAQLALDPSQLDLSFLLDQETRSGSGVGVFQESVLFAESLQQTVQEGISELLLMKEQEGSALDADLFKRLTQIETALEVIEARKEVPIAHYRSKIVQRLQQAFAESAIQSELIERVSKEVALFAEKMDITEEIVRLNAHVAQMRQKLKAGSGAIGRTLEFLVQEMHREINTIGSKSQDAEISVLVIQIKAEVDRMREQVQNIE